MTATRPHLYNILSYEARMQYMAHRAAVYISKPDRWLDHFSLVTS